MASKKPTSALISKYLEQYRRQPSSRVFAPLAESYRKLGMYDEALKVLKEGIKRHPTYALGYLVLAQCYFDQKKNDAAFEILQPLVPHNQDNPSLLRLFAHVCLEIGNLDEALKTFKYLLFLNPRDKYYAGEVKKLEDDLQRNNSIPIDHKAIVKAPPQTSFGVDEDSWSMVDFAPKAPSEPEELEEDNWSMGAPSEMPATKTITREDNWQVMSRSIDDDFFSDEEVTPEDAEAPIPLDSAPLASHTLVDIYVAQNHLESAIDLLENIVKINPNDHRSHKKLKDLQRRLSTSTDQADGEAELMRIIETEVKQPDTMKMEKILRNFLQEIQSKASERREYV